MIKFLSLFVLMGLASSVSAATCTVEDSAKVDCGYAGIDQVGCQSKGCCWVPAGSNSAVPWCFYGAVSSSYQLASLTTTSTGYSGVLNLLSGSTTYGSDITKLNLEVIYQTSNIIRIRITDNTQARWEIPSTVINRPTATTKPATMAYTFKYTANPFTFEVVRNSDLLSIFKTSTPFVYKDQYIELSTSIDASAKTFGIGESARYNQALVSGKTYTLWAEDLPSMSTSFDKNLYGSFPYYLQMVNGKAHGAMLMNSNGMDVTLASTSLTFKTIGGIIDLYVFVGPTPENVVQQYTEIVGRPMMMPYWSLGFHNCKYGYTSIYQVEQIVANYSAANIPLDTQWVDIDYMQNYKDFTLDPNQFPQAEVNSFVNSLHTNGQHFVPIIDPGIFVQNGYAAYDQGIAGNLFIKDIQGNNYLGQVWPGPTYFPDFFNPNTQSYWTNQLQSFYNTVPVDGIWIDMNEVSNFCNSDGNGQVCTNTQAGGCPAAGASQTDCCLTCKQVDSTNKYDYPPYNIHTTFGKLSQKTIAVSGTGYNGSLQYNTHNLYGLTEQIATNNAMATIRGKRPFILTRSSFLGTGVYSAKWTGDNSATWDDLKSSIVSVLDFNIFGIPMVGADICGFIYNTNEELCARWIEVGAFYPFSRNHNTLGAAPQELYLWPSVTQASQKALGMRYQMLPYMYTLFYKANSQGNTVARALWMNFASDANTLSNDRQFMLGGAVLISPVLDNNARSVTAYFPSGLWYDFSARSFFLDSGSGKSVLLDAPLTTVNVHVFGGNVLPLQNSALTTTAGRATPFTLLTALSSQGFASGSLFWDDGEQIALSNYLTVSYVAIVDPSTSSGSFEATVGTNTYPGASSLKVNTVVIMWNSLLQAKTSASLNSVALSPSQISFDATKSSLTFSNLDITLTSSFKITW